MLILPVSLKENKITPQDSNIISQYSLITLLDLEMKVSRRVHTLNHLHCIVLAFENASQQTLD